MNSRERIQKTFSFQVPDRIGIFDAPWPETVARWRKEGLPADVHVNDYFHYDIDECLLLDTSLRLPAKVIEKNEECLIYSDSNGVTNKVMRGKTGAPLVLDYLVKNRADWDEYKQRLRANINERARIIRWGEYEAVDANNVVFSPVPWKDTLAGYHRARKKNKFMLFLAAGPLENTTHMMAAQDVYMKMLEEPDFISDIFSTITDLIIEAHGWLARKGVRVDGFHFSDDIAYKNGLLFSPGIYGELLLPCHKKLCQYFKSQGFPVMYHTDGKLDEVLPLVLDTGITAIQPIEARAGNDVRKLKELYGDRLVFVGNIDVQKLGGSRKDIEEEIKGKVSVAKQNGGYIYHSDHSVPPSVSFENYKYAMELLRQYGGY